jgi:hypothetical protein
MGLDISAAVAAFHRTVTVYKAQRREADYVEAKRLKSELDRALAGYLSPRSRKLARDYAAVSATFLSAGPPREQYNADIQAQATPAAKPITSFLDLGFDDNGQTPAPSYVPPPQSVPTKDVVKEDPADQYEEDTYQMNGPVHVGDIEALEDRTQELKRLHRDSVALMNIQMQLAEEIETQDEGLSLLEEQMTETKNDQQGATLELIGTMRSKVRHLRRKCTATGAGVGLLSGLGVGGVVFSAPVIGLAVGLGVGGSVGLGVGQKWRRRWRRREEELTASIPPEKLASYNESIIDKASNVRKSATDSFLKGTETLRNGAESFVTGRPVERVDEGSPMNGTSAAPEAAPPMQKRIVRASSLF